MRTVLARDKRQRGVNSRGSVQRLGSSERAAAGDRVDGAAEQGGEEDARGVEECHEGVPAVSDSI